MAFTEVEGGDQMNDPGAIEFWQDAILDINIDAFEMEVMNAYE